MSPIRLNQVTSPPQNRELCFRIMDLTDLGHVTITEPTGRKVEVNGITISFSTSSLRDTEVFTTRVFIFFISSWRPIDCCFPHCFLLLLRKMPKLHLSPEESASHVLLSPSVLSQLSVSSLQGSGLWLPPLQFTTAFNLAPL